MQKLGWEGKGRSDARSWKMSASALVRPLALALLMVAAGAVDNPESTEQCGQPIYQETTMWYQAKEIGGNLIDCKGLRAHSQRRCGSNHTSVSS